MTATIEAPVVAPVVVTTLDGESREAYTCPDGSWSCPFCSGANFPEGHEHHRDYGWPGPCSNPACLVGGAMTEQATARIREDQRRREEREAQHKRWQDERAREEQARKAAAEALELKRQRGIAQAAAGRLSAVQLGFAWSCVKDECEVSGNDRAEFSAHMKDTHSLRSPRPVKLIRLRKGAPAASLPKLEVSPFKWLTWTETHSEPGTCECGHGTTLHQAWHGNDGTAMRCTECECSAWPESLPRPVTQEAERRGQFWAVGTHPHSVWVLPFDAAPWEDGRPGSRAGVPG